MSQARKVPVESGAATGKTDPPDAAKLISIRLLKHWAAEYLPSSSKLRVLILAEDETMSPEAFMAKWSSWQLLLKEEAGPV